MIGGERERCAAEFHRIDAQQQVMHDRVADQRRLEDVLMRNARLARHIRRQSAQRLAHRLRSSAPPRPGFIIEYETRLIRSSPKRICGFMTPAEATTSPLLKIAQVRGDRGGTDVDRKSVDQFVQARARRR